MDQMTPCFNTPSARSLPVSSLSARSYRSTSSSTCARVMMGGGVITAHSPYLPPGVEDEAVPQSNDSQAVGDVHLRGKGALGRFVRHQLDRAEHPSPTHVPYDRRPIL